MIYSLIYVVIYIWHWSPFKKEAHIDNYTSIKERICWCGWLKHCTISRKVAGLIPDGVNGIFQHNPSSRAMSLGSTLLLTETSTRNISWEVKVASAYCLPPSCSDCLENWQPQPLRVIWAWKGIAYLHFHQEWLSDLGGKNKSHFHQVHAICDSPPTFNSMGDVGTVTERKKKKNWNGKLKILRCYKTTQHTLWQAIFFKNITGNLVSCSRKQFCSLTKCRTNQLSQNRIFIHIQYKIQHMTMPCHNLTSHTANQTLHVIKQRPVFKMMNCKTRLLFYIHIQYSRFRDL
jgi:hypothetical protein